MPGGGGMEVLRGLRELQSGPEAIVLNAHGTVAVAVEAMKLGAYDFLSEPFHFDELRAVIDKAVEKRRLRRENLVLRAQIDRGRAAEILGIDPKTLCRKPREFGGEAGA